MRILRLSVVIIAFWLLAACSGVEMVPEPVRPVATEPATAVNPAQPQTDPAVKPPRDVPPVPAEELAATLPAGRPRDEFTPQASDAEMLRGPAFVDSAEIQILESQPPQFQVRLSGNLPSPCHSLRVEVEPPDDSGVIALTAYSVAPKDRVCAQMLQPFEAAIPLANLPAGKFSVTLDGVKVGELLTP